MRTPLEVAIAACDKKAIATFDAKHFAMNAAAASIKVKFDVEVNTAM